MKKFAQLLDRLYFSYRHKTKLNLLHDFFKSTADPERGYALAIMADTLEFPTFNRELIRELIHQRIDPFLFELSLDYVGDLSETIALLWPQKQESKLPSLTEIVTIFQQLSKTEMASFLAELLNQCNKIERWALLKIGTGNLRVGVSARFLKKALACYGQVNVLEIEQVWHNIKPPYLELFAWLEGKSSIPHSFDANFFHPVMLSHPLKEKDLALIKPEDFYAEYKYDGIRCSSFALPNLKPCIPAVEITSANHFLMFYRRLMSRRFWMASLLFKVKIVSAVLTICKKD